MNYYPTQGTATEKLVAAIRKLGRPVRSAELSKLTGVKQANLNGLLQTAIKHGLVTECLVQVPGQRDQREYKEGPGMPRGDDTPLSARSLGRPIIPVRESARQTISTQAAAPAQPKVAAAHGGNNIGSTRGTVSSDTPRPARAVAPKPRATFPARAPAASDVSDDAAQPEHIQAMSEDEFAEYINHLARVWSWGRARAVVANTFAQ